MQLLPVRTISSAFHDTETCFSLDSSTMGLPKSDFSHTGVTYLHDLPLFSPSSSALAAGRIRTRQSQSEASGCFVGGGRMLLMESFICLLSTKTRYIITKVREGRDY